MRTASPRSPFSGARRRIRSRLVAAIAVVLFTLALTPAAAAASAADPPGLPGPPPGAGIGFPAAPAAGTAPAPQPVGPPTTLPASVPGPGLRDGYLPLRGRHLTVSVACRTGGVAGLGVPALGAGVLSRARYTCVRGRGSAVFSLSAADAQRVAALGQTVANVDLGPGGGPRASVVLEAAPAAPVYWSDGGMVCNLLGSYAPYLAAPNFQDSPAAQIDVRPWVAWYTAANGWRWWGTAGLNRSSWYRWSASPTGVQQWVSPMGAFDPWTWAPIQIHPGHATFAIGAFEVIYWYAQPRYAWAYTQSWLGPSLQARYCTFP